MNLGLVQCDLLFDGVRLLLPCASGKVLSCIQHQYSYGAEEGKWEVLTEEGTIGNLSFRQVVAILNNN